MFRKRRLTLVGCLVVLAGLGCDQVQQSLRAKRRPPRAGRPAARQRIPVGSYGATIALQRSWERKRVNADLGDDQFVRMVPKEQIVQYLVVNEYRAVLECREDFETLMNNSGVLTFFEPSTVTVGDEFRQLDEGGHLRTRRETTLDGTRITYDYNLVGRDGLGYLFIFWTLTSKADRLHRDVDRFLGDIRLPGPESEWEQSHEPVVETVRQDNYEFRFQIDGGLYMPFPYDHDSFYARTTVDERITIMLYYIHGAKRLSEALNDSWASSKAFYEQNGRPTETLEHREMQLDGRDALMGIYRLDDGKAHHVDVVVELEPGVFLDLHYYCNGPKEVRFASLQKWLDSFEIERRAQLEAFPAVGFSGEVPWTPDSLAQLLATSDPWPRLGEHYVSFSLQPGGRLMGVRSSDVAILARGEERPQTVATWDENNWSVEAILVDDAVLYTTTEGDVQLIPSSGGSPQPLGFRADRLAALDQDQFLIVREARESPLAGLGVVPRAVDSELYVRRVVGGEERRLATFAGRRVLMLAADGEGRQVLVVSQDPHTNDDDGATQSRLSIVDLKDGIVEEHEHFLSVTAVGPAPRGWVLSGRHIDHGPLVAMLRPGGQLDQLATGSFITPIGIQRGQLIFTTSVAPLPHYTGYPELFSVDLDVVRQEGLAIEPFRVEDINKIALKVESTIAGEGLSRWYPAERAAVERIFAAAEEAANQGHGHSWPRQAEAIDRLLARAVEDERHGLSPSGEALLSVIVANALLEAGAEWVEGVEPNVGGPELSDIQRNDWAYGTTARRIVSGMRYQDWYQPLKRLHSGGRGRRLLIGNSPTAVARKVEQVAEGMPAIDKLPKGDVATIEEVLEAHKQNRHIRRQIYQELALNNRLRELKELAAAFDAGDSPAYLDRKFHLAARVALSGEEDSGEPPLGDALRETVKQFPSEAATYLLLGRFYERSGKEHAAELAAACYQKAYEVGDWETIGQDATAALQALEQASD
ncbi:MAG: hypothetical protein DWQ42_18115 [Planctomycetota bacterium]|nr:MAG: hypothetical protein DWQ42_18115 [Planctomycetota bacterium]REK44465.1 MAG: hypothetical protein DWQ46_09400 [Planctomycetota bacterium]